MHIQIDLIPMISKAGCECLNESDDHPFTEALSSGGGYLESDTDEQVGHLFSSMPFNKGGGG